MKNYDSRSDDNRSDDMKEEIWIYSGHPSTGRIKLGSRRPSGNRSVMESMHKRYKDGVSIFCPDDLEKDVEYAILADVFRMHWMAGFTEDIEEMLDISKRMVVALEKELQKRNNEHLETIMYAIQCVQKQKCDNEINNQDEGNAND